MRLAEWQKSVIEVGELYRVGGAIRDELLGIHVDDTEDVDFLVRAMEPVELEKRLRAHGRVEFVGKSFGVYKFRPTGDKRTFDIAYPRKERSTGVGHRDFDIEWDPDLPVETDLGRRDFTMNAIAQDVAGGSLIDPCGGRKDLESRVLRMIFPVAFAEDPLRILRGVRFAARFGLVADASTEAAMRSSVGLLATLSTERIQEELTRLLEQCVRPSEAFAGLHELGALGVILPELERAWGVEQNEYHPDDVFWHSAKSCDAASQDDLLVRWAALLHDLGKVDKKQTVADDDGIERVVFYGHEHLSADIARDVLTRLRYPNAFVDACTHLVAQHMFHYEAEWTDATVRRFIRRVGEENLAALFRLREADCGSRGLEDEVDKLNALRVRIDHVIAEQSALKVEDLAIDGRDVMQTLGVSGGLLVGQVLDALLEIVIEDPACNRRDVLLRYVKDHFG